MVENLKRYSPHGLKIQVQKMETFNFLNEKKDSFYLKKLIERIQRENITLDDLKIFLVNIKKIFLLFPEEEVLKGIDNIRIKKFDGKVDFIEKYIYNSALEMITCERFDIFYTHLNRLGKNLFKYMSFPKENEDFRRNFQKTFEKVYNKTFEGFLWEQWSKELNSSEKEIFFKNYFIDKNSSIYKKLLQKERV